MVVKQMSSLQASERRNLRKVSIGRMEDSEQASADLLVQLRKGRRPASIVQYTILLLGEAVNMPHGTWGYWQSLKSLHIMEVPPCTGPLSECTVDGKVERSRPENNLQITCSQRKADRLALVFLDGRPVPFQARSEKGTVQSKRTPRDDRAGQTIDTTGSFMSHQQSFPNSTQPGGLLPWPHSESATEQSQSQPHRFRAGPGLNRVARRVGMLRLLDILPQPVHSKEAFPFRLGLSGAAPSYSDGSQSTPPAPRIRLHFASGHKALGRTQHPYQSSMARLKGPCH